MDIFNVLEKIVGPRRVSKAEAVLHSYKYNCMLGILFNFINSIRTSWL